MKSVDSWIYGKNNASIILNQDNMTYESSTEVDLVYADMIYENLDLRWIRKYWDMLKTNGIFIVQTDYHSVAQVKIYLDSIKDSMFVNWLIYKQEWGGVPRKGFPQKHDDILIYCKGDNFYWDASEIQIPKATAGTAFDKKGTGLKTPCSVFDDLGNFSTMSKERIKNPETSKNIQWQKPMKLMDRLLTPFSYKGDFTIVDPFMGSGTTGEWCMRNGRNFVGIEFDETVYNIANGRLQEVYEELTEREGNFI